MNTFTTIVDVGARYGIHPTWKNFQGDALHVLIEADESEAKRLTLKYKAHTDVVVLNSGVTNISCVKSLNILKHRAFNSFLSPNTNSIWFDKVRPDECLSNGALIVECEPLDALLGDLGYLCDFLKINTEGTELDVLKGATNQLNNVLGIRMEVYFSTVFHESCLFGDVSSYLRGKDFILLNIDYFGQGSPLSPLALNGRFGVLEKADSVWVRDWNSVLRLPFVNENGLGQLLKYTSFCFENGAPDLALHVLSSYVDKVPNHVNFGDSKLASHVDKLTQFYLNGLMKHPIVSKKSISELYERLFSRNLKLRNDFYESMEINPK
jgi:FkbM family methyltransferase